ncbi:MAG: SMI1/KNR4 family protein [Hyalangium sp.]|uniref:SMI1/KNR4 family protein n=1 Tax=Hyalangium sp. TaxID=2028555 RepID=UPI00389AE076
MQRMLAEISHHHFPNPPAAQEEISSFEQRVGWRLDPELRAFYQHCNGADLFERRPETSYWILPLSKVIRARVAILGEDTDASGPSSWYVVCNVQDGNYVMVDVSTQNNGRYPLLDGWHEGFPKPQHCKQLAGSFSEFLEQALHRGGSLYWLKDEGESPR